MRWGPSRAGKRVVTSQFRFSCKMMGVAHMLHSLVNLLRHERFHCLSKGILPGEALISIPLHLQARRYVVDILGDVIVQERQAAFNRVRHFRPVAQTRHELIRQMAFCPDILRRIDGVPLLLYLLYDYRTDVVSDDVLRVR